MANGTSIQTSSPKKEAVKYEASAHQPNKVYIGNLSYQTKVAELKEFCEKAGKVTDVYIAFMGPRSLGYGFVTFETEEEADKSVEILKDSVLDNRTLHVEKARPKRDPGSPRRMNGGFRKGGAPGMGQGSFKGGFRPQGNNGPRDNNRGFYRKPFRPLRRQEGEPSKTTLFIGNLPFNAVEEDLMKIFTNFNPIQAKVLTRPNGLSRGFGFITLESEEMQTAALSALSEIWCDDRKLIVKQALSPDVPNRKESITGSA